MRQQPKHFFPTANDSQKPEDLWAFLERTKRETGAEFVAIPHNSNLSGGLMFEMVDSTGRTMTAGYARMRIRWEPVMEATQAKGIGVHRAFAERRVCGFEVRRSFLPVLNTVEQGGLCDRHSCVVLRSSRVSGQSLQVQNDRGFGSHTGLSSVEETDFWENWLWIHRKGSMKPARP
jgi:hypothetical protein